MVEDLSLYHHTVSELFPQFDLSPFRLNDEQIEIYRQHRYLAGIKMLDSKQNDALREELAELVAPSHPGHELFYEFNANESADPQQILFHALGGWRIKPGLHDLLWH